MNKSNVLEQLNKACKKVDFHTKSGIEGLTSDAVAEGLKIRRNIASHHLNILFREGEVVKINTRPVYFIPVKVLSDKLGLLPSKDQYASIDELLTEDKDNVFNGIIGADGSLEECIRQCKAAVNYPNGGLPLLLNGPTGSGKSFIAKKLSEYARKNGIIKPDAPFNILNCAEYANNPELLTSKLFGHIKGSFTGAGRDQAGIIETSDEGILFLDEVHRLSAEGQEKLFIFMDEGIYRRMGENTGWRTAKVRLIFATTEDVSKSLIETFLRRIPIIVGVSSVDERGYPEKLDFIYYFFTKEARNIGRNIKINSQVIDILLNRIFSANVGELENVVKYTCANAYFSAKEAGDEIVIKTGHLPGKIAGMDKMANKINPADHSVMIHCDGSTYNRMAKSKDAAYEKLKKECMDGFNGLLNGSAALKEFQKSQYESVTKYIDGMLTLESDSRSRTIEEIIESGSSFIDNNYDVDISGECSVMLAKYISAMPRTGKSPEKPARVQNSAVKYLSEHFGTGYHISRKIIDIIELRYDIKFALEDAILLAVILSNFLDASLNAKLKALIIAHGYSTASSIANMVNRMLGEKIFKAIDMPGDMSFLEVSARIKDYVRHTDTREGLLFLVDMGHIDELYKAIAYDVQGAAGFIDNVSTRMALDVGSRILLNENFEDIVVKASQANISTHAIYQSVKKKKKAFISTCPTGIGTAFKIKSLVESGIGPDIEIEVVACEYSRLLRNKQQDPIFSKYDVIAIIGTANPGIGSFEFVGLDELLGDRGYSIWHNLLKAYLSEEKINYLNNNMIKIFSLENVVNSLTILNPAKTIAIIEEVLFKWQVKMNCKFPNDLVISLYVHLSCMIERLVTRNEMTTYKNIEEFEENHQAFIKIIKKSFSVVETLYNSDIPLAEIGYIHDIFQLKLPQFKL